MEDDYSFLCLLHFFLSESALLRIVMWKLDPKVLSFAIKFPTNFLKSMPPCIIDALHIRRSSSKTTLSQSHILQMITRNLREPEENRVVVPEYKVRAARLALFPQPLLEQANTVSRFLSNSPRFSWQLILLRKGGALSSPTVLFPFFQQANSPAALSPPPPPAPPPHTSPFSPGVFYESVIVAKNIEICKWSGCMHPPTIASKATGCIYVRWPFPS